MFNTTNSSLSSKPLRTTNFFSSRRQKNKNDSLSTSTAKIDNLNESTPNNTSSELILQQPAAAEKKVDFFDNTDEDDDNNQTSSLSSDYSSDDDDESELVDKETSHFLNEKTIENKNKVVSFKIDLSLPRSGLMFWIEILKVALMVQIIVIGLLISVQLIEINNYLYMIIDSIFTLLICGLNLGYLFIYNMRNKNLAYDHIGTLWSSAVFTAGVLTLVWFSFGRWLYVYAICCNSVAQTQPDPTDLVNFISYYGSVSLQIILPTISLVVYSSRAFIAIKYPLTTAPSYKKKDK